MAKNVLIATLGESPIVVTSMVKALQAKKGMTIDQLHVVHPQGEKLIALGYDMVKEHFEDQCQVNQCILPFPDTNSRAKSMKFLQILSGLIEFHESEEDQVYLSLAGGRKNMSALMAVTCQFFECVRGLYHILDKHEDNPNKRNFHSIEELFEFEEAKQKQKLSSKADDLILVEIPYPHLSNGVVLRQYFNGIRSSIEIEGEIDEFYRKIFQKKKTEYLDVTERLDVYLSKAAYDQFKKNKKLRGGSTRKQFMNCFRSMRYSKLLEEHNHSLPHAKTDCKCFKMGNTAERPFYYRTNGEVVVCEPALKNTTYPDIADGKREIWSKDHDKFVNMSELEDNCILIAPLGKSPLVVTQTFTLLSEREKVNLKKIIVVHPNNAEIRNGANLLKEAFRRKRIDFEPILITDIRDVMSDDDCEIYLEKLVSVIENVQGDDPDKSIYLSLSGGRKGMTALTLFAAQRANIDAVYHTLITDIELEKKIEEETTLTVLQGMTRQNKVKRLFLDAYDKSKFEVFRVPVIPM